MSALTVSAIIFLSTLGGIFLGALLRRTFPKHHLNEHAKDVVRLGVGLTATITALVLGLLSLFAFSSACGIFLILELSRPFTGLLRLSSVPLRNALGTI